MVPCADILLVTTHDWDIAGAANAGMKTAYMRKTKAGGTYPFLNTPNITLRTMEELTQVYA